VSFGIISFYLIYSFIPCLYAILDLFVIHYIIFLVEGGIEGGWHVYAYWFIIDHFIRYAHDLIFHLIPCLECSN